MAIKILNLFKKGNSPIVSVYEDGDEKGILFGKAKLSTSLDGFLRWKGFRIDNPSQGGGGPHTHEIEDINGLSEILSDDERLVLLESILGDVLNTEARVALLESLLTNVLNTEQRIALLETLLGDVLYDQYRIDALENLLITETGLWVPNEPSIRNVTGCSYTRNSNMCVLTGRFGFNTNGSKTITGLPKVAKYTMSFMITSDADNTSVCNLVNNTLTITNARQNGIYYLYVIYEPL